MSRFLTRFDGRFAHLAINGGLKMKYAREFIVNAVVGGLLVLLPIYLAVLVLLKGMQSVVGLLRPIAALLPDWVPGENFWSLVVVLIICFAVGAAVRTRVGRVVRERMEMSFFGRLPGYALFRGLSQRLAGERRERVEARARRDRGCARSGLHCRGTRRRPLHGVRAVCAHTVRRSRLHPPPRA